MLNKICRTTNLLVLASVAAVSNFAFGATVQPATYSYVMQYGDGNGHYPFLNVNPAAPGTYTLGEQSVSLSGTPQSTIEATASSSPAGGGTGATSTTGGAVIKYNFQFLGEAGTTLPISIENLLQVEVTGSRFNFGSGDAYVMLADLSVGEIARNSVSCDVRLDCLSMSSNTPIKANILSNTEYQIEVHAGWQATGGNTAHVLADPTVSIDSDFTNRGAFTLMLSDGIGNGPVGTPEPATFGMIGMAGLAAIVVRRRNLRRQ